MLDRLHALNTRVLTANWAFLGCLAAYLGVLLVLRVTLFPGASEDDAEQLFFAQTWALGYKPNQPPLYTWLVIAAEQLLGPSIAAVEAVKFGALFAAYGFLHAAGRRLFDDARLPAVAALSIIGFYYMGWDVVMNYSHTVLLATAVAATLWAVLRISDATDRGAFAVLGLVIGLGLMSKYNYALFLFALVAASLWEPRTRSNLLSPNLLLTSVIALSLALPHYLWFVTDPAGMAAAQVASKPPSGGGAIEAVRGLLKMLQAAAAFVLPGAVLILAVFPRLVRRLPDVGSAAPHHRRLLGAYFVILAAAMTLLVLGAGLQEFRGHWMVVLLPLPLYLFARIERIQPDARRLGVYVLMLEVLALAVAGGIIARDITGPAKCRKCNFFVPYGELAAQLKAAGVGGGTVITIDYPNQLAGNLRRYFPSTRFVGGRYDPFVPPRAGGGNGSCVVLWNAALGEDRNAWPSARNFGQKRLAMRFAGAYETQFAEAPIRGAGGRTFRLAFVKVTEGKGECR